MSKSDFYIDLIGMIIILAVMLAIFMLAIHNHQDSNKKEISDVVRIDPDGVKADTVEAMIIIGSSYYDNCFGSTLYARRGYIVKYSHSVIDSCYKKEIFLNERKEIIPPETIWMARAYMHVSFCPGIRTEFKNEK